MLKTLIVYVHLLATAFALVELLKFDFRLLRKLHQPLTVEDRQHLQHVRITINLSLALLWITGIGLVVLGALEAPAVTLANEKLWMKILAVLLLTLNGILVHRVAVRWLVPGLVIGQIPLAQQQLLFGMGTISTVSWLFAAFLGIARIWNNNVRIEELLVLYGALLIAAMVMVNILLAARPQRNTTKQAAETRGPS
jgi:hypothetical protein